MKDRAEQSLEQKLFEMAEREEMILPDTLQDRMDDILVRLTKRRKYRMTWRKSVVLAAALTAMLSITVTAAVSVLQQRMEAMNEKEMEEYFVQIYRNAIGVDNYNRPYTESEKERMEQLRKSYEETGLFPKGALTMISEPEAYRGKGVAFYGDTATFFFPEKEMSDEELLQIIDFMQKRDYSLQAMNEKLAAGEIESPTETVKKKIDLSPYQEKFGGRISRMVVDDRGYIYIRTLFSNCLLFVFDEDGNYVKAITSDTWQSHPAGGLGIGRDGKVYTQIEGRGTDSGMGIASVNPESGCLEDVYENIMPEGTIMIDIIAPGSDTDFVFWGYDGIFTWNLGEESAVNVLPAYEAPCPWEGCMYCALPDGRIVFGYSTDYRTEGEGDNRRTYRVPEKTCFYYKAGLRR